MAKAYRLLCLHGMYQNAELFAKKTAGVQRALGACVELVHIQASHQASPKPRLSHIRNPNPSHIRRHDSEPLTAGHFVWWKEGCSGWEATLNDVIRSRIHADGPFLGVLGFSQGATTAALLCTNKVAQMVDFRPKIAIIISGRHSKIHDEEYESGMLKDLVSVHWYGSNDQVTPPVKSERLVDSFKHANPVHVYAHEHHGGHIIPEVSPFLQQQLREAIRQAATETSDCKTPIQQDWIAGSKHIDFSHP